MEKLERLDVNREKAYDSWLFEDLMLLNYHSRNCFFHALAVL